MGMATWVLLSTCGEALGPLSRTESRLKGNLLVTVGVTPPNVEIIYIFVITSGSLVIASLIVVGESKARRTKKGWG
jgi:hypothetical protein